MPTLQMADEKKIASCIRGYHIYKTVWKARIVKVLSCVREPTNAIDRYAVSVFKNSTVVGHLPKEFLEYVLRLFVGVER